MNLYYSTCAAGIERVAAEVASKATPKFILKECLSGAVIYEAKHHKPSDVFSNTYLLITKLKSAANVEQAAQELMMDKRRMREVNDKLAQLEFDSVRVMFSNGNVLQSVNPKLRETFERQLKIKVDRVRPKTELLVLRRTDGATYLLIRLTGGSAEKKAAKGELSRGIALCMAHLARPTPDGVLLDPFAGAGAIGRARSSIGKAKKIYLFDDNPKRAGALKLAFRGPLYETALQDALTLAERLPENSVTEIATDPPWGLFEPLKMDASEFYKQMLASFAHVLKEEGNLALLTADKEAFSKALRAHASFDQTGKIDVLVNGKKAAIYTAQKI